MQAMNEKFLESCPRVKGFRMRGAEMTRIEVFVDAAFAFAVTMLVISFDAIPNTFDEMVIAIKMIPAFIVAVAQLVWLWQTHTTWSQRYGLDDGPTVWLSALLLVVVLIYIYPMRVMLEGMFAWLTNGYLPTSFELRDLEELRFMFAFLGVAFAALCLSFVLMYRYALRRSGELLLNAVEQSRTRRVIWIWSGCMCVSFLLVIAALLMPRPQVPFAGFTMLLIGIWIFYVEARFEKQDQELQVTP